MYKVLLVDDEYMVTEGLKRLIPFDKWDMEVVATVSHADEALEYVQENPVDVIISDVNMPDKTGLDMIREMKEILPDAAYHAIQSFDELVPYIKETLTSFFGQYRMNENVVSVLEVIGRDYQKELSLKDISKALFINPVYLGQLIKRETDSTFAELLNKQRIKAAQQLLLSTSDSIEDICYAVGYSNLGYFYKVFRKLCGKSPKAYRKQVETIL